MRLSLRTLRRLPAEVSEPGYDPTSAGIGIVHLGIGAFHRCHMAVYTDQVLSESGGDWRILGVSLRSAKIRDQLEPQDGLYTVVTRGVSGDFAEVIASVAGVMWAPEDPPAVINAMAAPTVKIISLTVTEKGYCHDPATGELNAAHPDIVHDLANLSEPKSAIGYVVAALLARRARNAGPITILCCDNLPSNGVVVERMVSAFARCVDPGLADWIADNVTFPSTMVDRIVPAMESQKLVQYRDQYAMQDDGLLETEPFSQWVIEDKFAADRPHWENAGALFVGDVAPFEAAKLRMLNGAHSALAYLGFLRGYEFVHLAMGDRTIRHVVDDLMGKEAAASLDVVPEGLDLDAYRGELQQRFDNPALQHRTYQIAMDGSQKIPQRLLSTIRAQLEYGGPIGACCLGIAGWMRYILGRSEAGIEYAIQDPLADRLVAIAREHEANPAQLCRALLGQKEVFGTELPKSEAFVAEVSRWTEGLYEDGIEKTLNVFCSES